MSCDAPDLADELRHVCDGLADSLHEVMAGRVGIPVLKAHSPRKAAMAAPFSSALIANGMNDKRDQRDPFSVDPDRAVGVRINASSLPLQFSTQMVQPGDPGAADRLNWELRTVQGAADGMSGTFMTAAANGNYESHGGSESVSAAAGVRRYVQPVRGVRVGSEIAPSLSISDEAVTSMAIAPKIITSASFDQVADTNLSATLSANVTYNLPAEGDPSTQAGFRLTFRPR
ncbi:hypothetical protein [Terrihabitans sp. B22-R8]|uniref:hypothetical protein n=1 Tax=Terrihabitans sp. B22-R8 TaxID=3425128 RepID=UPI00403C9A27